MRPTHQRPLELSLRPKNQPRPRRANLLGHTGAWPAHPRGPAAPQISRWSFNRAINDQYCEPNQQPPPAGRWAGGTQYQCPQPTTSELGTRLIPLLMGLGPPPARPRPGPVGSRPRRANSARTTSRPVTRSSRGTGDSPPTPHLVLGTRRTQLSTRPIPSPDTAGPTGKLGDSDTIAKSKGNTGTPTASHNNPNMINQNLSRARPTAHAQIRISRLTRSYASPGRARLRRDTKHGTFHGNLNDKD